MAVTLNASAVILNLVAVILNPAPSVVILNAVVVILNAVKDPRIASLLLLYLFSTHPIHEKSVFSLQLIISSTQPLKAPSEPEPHLPDRP